MMISQRVRAWSQEWLLVTLVVAVVVLEVSALSGHNVCMVKQKYNITKRIKYRAPMSVRTYEWCFNMPPRCSRWNTEMRDLTRLETEERTAEVAVCCPGYKMKDVSCVPICPNGKTGPGCSEDCMPHRWGPNCVHECRNCTLGECSAFTGECICQAGWQGESCEIFVSTTKTSTTPVEDILTTSIATKTTLPSSTEFMLITSSKSITVETTSRAIRTTVSTSTTPLTTPKVETTTTQLTTSTKKLDDNSLTTSPKSATRLTSSDKDVDSSSVEIRSYITTNKALRFNNDDKIVIRNKTVRPVEPPKSTYLPEYNSSKSETTPALFSSTIKQELDTTIKITTTDAPSTKIIEITKPTLTNVTLKYEYTRKPDTTVKTLPTTMKFKPKEIWIRPAQKGELPTIETKTKGYHDLPHVKFKSAAKIEIIPNTTPKTIIVSIIPTSVSYATFKKIALTTASYTSQKNSTIYKANNKTAEGFTKSMSVQTSTTIPFIKPINATYNSFIFTQTPSITNESVSTPHTTLATTRRTFTTKYSSVNKTTNSMSRTSNVVSPKLTTSNSLTTATVSLTNITSYSHRRNVVTEKVSITPISTTANIETSLLYTTERTTKKVEVSNKNTTKIKPDKVFETILTNELTNKTATNTKTNVATSETNTVTSDKPAEDEEKFHILTEPEHITAVMSEKETERSSVDLISVISIAGGVMMAVITVAVIIVMMERCKRPRYDNVRKINDIRMQVMIDNHDEPPPYVRSIFHTPLPDPPSEKCHYQPISTLDRNLKQFMRPVVVQTISPMMLENFRGILECHYDHLPRRSHDFIKMQSRCSVPPSIEQVEQHQVQRASLTDSAIDALKCEAKMDVIDSTTLEPLYAEIPCWRPPSEHAVEVINNLNGEAVTEL